MKLKVAVCICTFKRPLYLSRLLNSLLPVLSEIEFNVIIVDNDKNGSAKEVYNSFKGKLPLIYELEKEQGLSSARNKCIEKARELNLDYIVFLDDDEVVKRKDWLSNLIFTAKKYDTGIVTGPVLPLYQHQVKGYIKKSNIFSPPRYENGTELLHTGTGNTLVKLSILSHMEQVFCEKFNHSGGEDTYLFLELVRLGHSIVWCDEAEILEFIPVERANIPYIFKRSFYSAVNFTQINSISNNFNKGKTKIQPIRLLKGLVKILRGGCIVTLFLFIGMHKLVQGVSLIGKD
ncbi:glycosyltransferase family 2 protein [Bacillus sp. EB93]|nr:glycosyltransferase family 2 protein [Peribacillus frigoritolerans]